MGGGEENLTETNKFLSVVLKKKKKASWVLSRSDYASDSTIIYKRKMKKCWCVEFSEVGLEVSP